LDLREEEGEEEDRKLTAFTLQRQLRPNQSRPSKTRGIWFRYCS